MLITFVVMLDNVLQGYPVSCESRNLSLGFPQKPFPILFCLLWQKHYFLLEFLLYMLMPDWKMQMHLHQIYDTVHERKEIVVFINKGFSYFRWNRNFSYKSVDYTTPTFNIDSFIRIWIPIPSHFPEQTTGFLRLIVSFPHGNTLQSCQNILWSV